MALDVMLVFVAVGDAKSFLFHAFEEIRQTISLTIMNVSHRHFDDLAEFLLVNPYRAVRKIQQGFCEFGCFIPKCRVWVGVGQMRFDSNEGLIRGAGGFTTVFLLSYEASTLTTCSARLSGFTLALL
mmetsp:Transcript_26786/g.57560  ORF Transcript_26786/g.57560 Transcript_26786/m.57560 type:complete len:127 (-) Transcript_26786:72-452(-)